MRKSKCCPLLLAVAALMPFACTNSNQTPNPEPNTERGTELNVERTLNYTEARQTCTRYSPQRVALFGDLHVHTAYSFDASANSLETYPEDAHRFAQGESIPFFPLDDKGKPLGKIHLSRPLDFVAITDHGEFLGERALCRTPESPRYDTVFCQAYRQTERQAC